MSQASYPEERGELRHYLLGAFLRKEVAAVEGVPADIIGLLTPGTGHLVRSADAPRTPEDEHGTTDAARPIGVVVGEVDRRPRAIVLATRMDRGCIEAPAVMRERSIAYRSRCSTPLAEGPAQVECGVRPDHPLRKIGRLDEEEVPPGRRGSALIEPGVHRLCRDDVEKRQPRDDLLMIECQAPRYPATSIVADHGKTLEAECAHEVELILRHHPFGIWDVVLIGRRLRAVAIAAQICADHRKALGEHRGDAVPGDMRLRVAVEE